MMKRYITGGVGIAVLLACGPTFIDALPFRFGHTASNSEKTFKMVTYNCLHMTDINNPDSKTNRSLHFLIHSDADFICLQELLSFNMKPFTGKYKSQTDSLLNIYPYYTNEKKDVKFLSKYPFEELKTGLSSKIKNGYCSAYRMNIDGEELTVINVHLASFRLSDDERNIITQMNSQTGVKNSFKEFEGSIYGKLKTAFRERAEITKYIAEYAASIDGNVIICGDFNDVPGSYSYRNIIKSGFEDAYAQTGFGHLITYNQHLMWFHIDQILYKGDLIPLYVRKERLSTSDHYPLVAEFEFL